MTQPAERATGGAAVAYFSIEIGLESAIPTYSGGLGVLAGDTLRAAADLGLPLVAVTLLYHKGYFQQRLDEFGRQTEVPSVWSPEEFVEPLAPRVAVTLEGRRISVRAWRYLMRGASGHVVPVYLLDTDLPENSPRDRGLTDYLYGGDTRYRLGQEALLGLAGVAMLRALGHRRIRTYHMNEGHCSFLTLALLGEQTRGWGIAAATVDDTEAVRQRCVFTTHTPVPAGHDVFPLDMVRGMLGDQWPSVLEGTSCCYGGALNMTQLALYFSRYANGVSLRHQQISQDMFPTYPVDAITNGVHAATWASPAFQRLYDRFIPEWRRDNLYLRYAGTIPLDQIEKAHAEAKWQLLQEVDRRTGARFEPGVMTIGFARRSTAYKRADLLFSDLERLKRIARQAGGLQVIYAGKAHPRDEAGKALIRRIFEAAALLEKTVRVVYLQEYDMALGRRICSGVDLWLNTPQKPLEASGTSGMKAALNGVPSLSVLDGWWIEGHVEGVTGWSVGEGWETESDAVREAASLYTKLESTIIPMFYEQPSAYAEVMRSAIALNGSFFNTQRMVNQYLMHAYRLTLA